MENVIVKEIEIKVSAEQVKKLVKLSDKLAFRSAAVFYVMFLPLLGLFISLPVALAGLAISNVLILILIIMNFISGRKMRKLLNSNENLKSLSA